MKTIIPPSSGSVGNLVYSRNRGGQYTRARTTPFNTVGSGRRALVRGFLTTAAQAWTVLPFAEQSAWEVAAANHPRRNSLGQPIVLSGRAAFIGIVCARLNCFGFFGTAPPSSWSVYSTFGAGISIDLSGNINVTMPGNGTAFEPLLVSVSKRVSTGRRAWFTWWQVSSTNGADTGPDDITTDYTAEYGFPVTGDRIFVKFVPFNADGVAGQPYITFGDAP